MNAQSQLRDLLLSHPPSRFYRFLACSRDGLDDLTSFLEEHGPRNAVYTHCAVSIAMIGRCSVSVVPRSHIHPRAPLPLTTRSGYTLFPGFCSACGTNLFPPAFSECRSSRNSLDRLIHLTYQLDELMEQSDMALPPEGCDWALPPEGSSV